MARPRQLVTSQQLADFFASTRREAQGLLPLVVRRLVLATAKPGTIGFLSFAAGDDVRLPGYDGRVSNSSEHPYIPSWDSVWEMGVSASPKSKADSDYTRRTERATGADRSSKTYVCVTPRVWAGSDAWARSRRAEGAWRDVRVIDGQVLSEWFDLAPAVARWFHAQRGAPADDIDDAESGWYRVIEEPLDRDVSAALVQGGRIDEATALRSWLLRPTGDLSVAGESADEVVAFVLAAVRNAAPESPEAHLGPRLLVARGRSAIHFLGSLHSPHVVVVADPGLGAELRAAKLDHVHLVLPVPERATASRADHVAIRLPAMKREAIVRELVRMGVDGQTADRVARESRGSLHAVLWGLGSRALHLLPWLAEPHASLLAPLVLARQWPVSEHADWSALEKLSGRTRSELRGTLMTWRTAGGPIHVWGGNWDWKAWRVAWEQLAPHFILDLMQRFADVTIEVLGVRDPALELPPGERWMANVRELRHPHSAALRSGLASSLAMFGALSDSNSGFDGRWVASRVVRDLLDSDAQADRWLSIAPWLPLLAEAAPVEFIDTVDRLVADRAAVAAIFEDGGPFASRPHTHLLWSLERLAWNARFMPRVLVLLGRLMELDLAVSCANTPRASMIEILRPEAPGTAAAMTDRLAAFDCLRVRCPRAAWDVALHFCTFELGFSMPPQVPQYRDWHVEAAGRPVAGTECAAFMDAIGDRLIEMAGTSPERWRQCTMALPELLRRMPSHGETAIEALNALDTRAWSPDERGAIHESLRKVIAHHEGHPDADWSLDSSELARLRVVLDRFVPERPEDRHRYLFVPWPRLGLGPTVTWQEEQAHVRSARLRAVEQVRAVGGVAAVIAWAGDVESPEALGGALADVELAPDEEDRVLAASLIEIPVQHAEVSATRFGRGFVHARAHSRGTAWGLERLRWALREGGVPGAVQVALSLPPRPHLWADLDSLNSELAQQYWRKVALGYLDIEAAEVALRRLLAVGRTYAGIMLVSLLAGPTSADAADPTRSTRTHAMCLLALGEIPSHSPTAEAGLPDVAAVLHAVVEVMDVLQGSGSNDTDIAAVLAKWEWLWLPALRGAGRLPVALSRRLCDSPEFLVEVLSSLYRDERCSLPSDTMEAAPRLSCAQAQATAERAWHLLEGWRIVPGLDLATARFAPESCEPDLSRATRPSVSGTVDASLLAAWVTRARQLAASAHRGTACDRHIGQVLAHSPADPDGRWPCQAVRAIVEAIGSPSLERGFVLGVVNRRGIHFVGRTGDEERTIRDAFEAQASLIAAESPRTASALRCAAEHYAGEGLARDGQGRRREFSGPW